MKLYLIPHLYGITWIPKWINDYIPSKMCDEITYQFPNLNGAAVDVSELISNFIQYLTVHVITYPCCDSN